jgi:ClpP class serine protease
LGSWFKKFSSEEKAHFKGLVNSAYNSFVTKAAASRNMTIEEMEKV